MDDVPDSDEAKKIVKEQFTKELSDRQLLVTKTDTRGTKPCDECPAVTKVATNIETKATELHSVTRAKILLKVLEHSIDDQDHSTASTAFSAKLFFAGIVLSVILFSMTTVFPKIEPVNKFHEFSLLTAKYMPAFGLALIMFVFYNISSLIHRDLVSGPAGTRLDLGSWTAPHNVVAHMKSIAKRKFFGVWGLDVLYTLGWLSYAAGYLPVALGKADVNYPVYVQASILALAYFVLGIMLHKLAKDLENTIRNLAFRRYPEKRRITNLKE